MQPSLNLNEIKSLILNHVRTFDYAPLSSVQLPSTIERSLLICVVEGSFSGQNCSFIYLTSLWQKRRLPQWKWNLSAFFFFFTRIWLDWYRYKTLTSGNWKQDTVFSLSLHSWCPLRWTDFWRNLNSFKMQYHVAEPCPQFRLIFICVTLCRYEIWHHKFKWWSKDEMHQLPLKTVILWKTDRWIERQKKNRPHEVLEILPFLWMLYLRRCCIIINSFSRITFYDMDAWHLSKAFKITYIGRKKYWRDLSLFQELEHF